MSTNYKLSSPQKQTARLAEIAANAKKAKQFQRLDFGGRNQVEAIEDYIEKEILNRGGKMGKDTKILTIKAIKAILSKQVESCRKRTNGPLDEIIRLAGG